MKQTQVEGIRAKNYGPFDELSIQMEGSKILLLEGPNEAGKSKIIQTYATLASQGGEHVLKDDTTDGFYTLSVVVDGDKYTITREFDASGKDKLTVTDEFGVKVPTTKTNLQRIFNPPTLDPLGLANMKEKDIVNRLFKISHYDPTPLDDKREVIYLERGDVFRDRQAKLGVMREMGVSDEEIEKYKSPKSHTEIMSTLESMISQNEELDRVVRELEDLVIADKNADTKLQEAETRYLAKVSQIKEQIAALHKELEDNAAKMEDYRNGIKAKKASMAAEMATRVSYTESHQKQDVSSIKEELASVEAHNENHRKVLAFLKAMEESDALATKHNELTQRINQIDKEKADQLAKLDLPLGLSIQIEKETTETGKEKANGKVSYVPYYNGRRLSDKTSNTASIYMVGVELAMLELATDEDDPANVLRLDASPLDDTSLQELVDLIKERGFFAFIEKPKGTRNVDKLEIKKL